MLRHRDRRRSLKAIDNFNYVTSAVLTPLFLVAGTFFPLTGLPQWAQVLAQFNPLYHCVQLVRHAVFGFEGWVDVWHVAFLVVFALAMWRLAIWRDDAQAHRLRGSQPSVIGLARYR